MSRYPVRSGSRQRIACWRSRTHRRCPTAEGTSQLFPLKFNQSGISMTQQTVNQYTSEETEVIQLKKTKTQIVYYHE